MFGTNPLRKVDDSDGQTLWIQDVFGTIQGEGPLVGSPSIFVRLAGCNLACHFCDTDFESSDWRPTLDELIEKIEAERLSVAADLVVLTGGEPLRQNIGPLMKRLLQSGFRVQVETAGTVWPSGCNDSELDLAFFDGRAMLVCSPKTGTLNKQVQRRCTQYKYIVAADTNWYDGVPADSTQMLGRRTPLFKPEPPAQIWLQPRMDYKLDGTPDDIRTAANTTAAVNVCMRLGYRLSLQIHKTLQLP